MSWPNSPEFVARERDFATFTQEAATAPGGYAGTFKWGPVEEATLLTSAGDLVNRYHKPTDDLYLDFFTVFNYLEYSSAMYVVRTVDEATALNAASDGTPILIKNEDDFEDRTDTVASFYAKYPSALGNSIQVHFLTSTTWVDATDTIKDLFSQEPVDDEIHIAIEDTDGGISGTEGNILETYEFLKPTQGAKKEDGSSAYFVRVLNTRSEYVWATGNYVDLISDGTADDTFANVDTTDVTLTGGVDGNNEDGSSDDQSIKQPGWNVLLNENEYDVSLVPTGAASDTLQDWILQSFAEERQDCVAFFSPPLAAVRNKGNERADVLTWANDRPSSSYGAMDSGWKYQYDRWNDTNRWVPLNADIAGLWAQSENRTEAWYAGAGYTRGQIKNVVRLSWNPKKADQVQLFQQRVNPVIQEAGEGTINFGDQTMLSRPSPFGEIGVRRLFIVLRKSILNTAKYKLFEFNDEITRNRFVRQTQPFLRDIQSRRGITGFRVKCDSENNTPQVINNNRFVGQIAVRPNRSIRFGRLDFIATPEGVDFDEVIEEA